MKFLLALTVLLFAVRSEAGITVYRAFAGNPVSLADRITNLTLSPPDRVMRLQPGGQFTHEMVFDFDAPTAFVSVVFHAYSPDVAPTGNVCLNVCLGVNEIGGLRSAMNMTACKRTDILTLTTQYKEAPINVSLIVPKKTTGVACASGVDCKGQEMVMSVTYTTCGVSDSANLVDIQSVIKFQE